MIPTRRRPAEHRADQERELDVAHAHAARVGERREEEKAGGAERAERPLRRRIGDRLQPEHGSRSRQHDPVRDDPPLEVGGGRDDERGAARSRLRPPSR